MVIYMLKQAARKLFAREQYEEFCINDGIGKNGKGAWTEILRALFGSYAHSPALQVLTGLPPSGNQPSPAWMALRGKRLLVVTETEGTLRLNSTSMKMLRDQSSVISARNLYKDLMEFNPMFGLDLSTNVAVKFSTLDGGIERSCASIEWPFHFCAVPAKEHERKVNPKMKESANIRSMLPDLFGILCVIDIVFTKDWADSIVGPRPVPVQNSTKKAMTKETTSTAQSFIDEMLTTTKSTTAATPQIKIEKALIEYASTLSKKQVKELIDEHFDKVGANVDGSRKYLLRVKGGRRGEYAMLK
jgi:hypothetical protein